jgi:hypothetical protein
MTEYYFTFPGLGEKHFMRTNIRTLFSSPFNLLPVNTNPYISTLACLSRCHEILGHRLQSPHHMLNEHPANASHPLVNLPAT